jgi:hypothetical protein
LRSACSAPSPWWMSPSEGAAKLLRPAAESQTAAAEKQKQLRSRSTNEHQGLGACSKEGKATCISVPGPPAVPLAPGEYLRARVQTGCTGQLPLHTAAAAAAATDLPV